MPLFLRGGDLISVDPMISGYHEPEIVALIDFFARFGHDGFFLDIGANIGLISCQVGHRFGVVHMFEPNPLVLPILRANVSIASKKKNYFIHEFGLGPRGESLQMFVPNNNWGGAFVRSTDNEYNDSTLAKKDLNQKIGRAHV